MNQLSRLFIALTCCASVGAYFFWPLLEHGPSVQVDSVDYLRSAQSVAAGLGTSTVDYNGEVNRVTHYPPFTAVVFSIPYTLNWNVMTFIAILNVFLFAVSIVLIGTITFLLSSSFIASVLAALLFSFSSVMIYAFGTALSEPGFITIMLGLMTFFILNWKKNISNVALINAALITSLAILSRYIGIAWILSGVFWICVGKATISRKLKQIISFALISVSPIFSWMLLAPSTSPIGNRAFSIHAIGIAKLQAAMLTLKEYWLVPTSDLIDSGQLLLPTLILLGVVGAKMLFEKKHLTDAATVFIVGSAVTYVAFVLLSITFVDASTPLDNRLLAPMYPFALVLFLTNRDGRVFTFLIVGFLFVAYLSGGPQANLGKWDRHLWYNSESWRNSTTRTAAREIPRELAVYSNAPEVLMLDGRVNSRSLPNWSDPMRHQNNPNFGAEIEVLKKDIESENAAIVLFRRVNWRWYLPGEDVLKANLSLRPVWDVDDGAVYMYKKPS